MNMIQVSNLSKEYSYPVRTKGIHGAVKHLIKPHYETIKAVQDVNFSIKRGEKVAFIGANGAGKSTIIKMLTGILQPTNGKVCVNGIDPFTNRIKNASNIGALFGQKSQLWWDIPLNESYKLLKNIYNIPNSLYHENMDEFVELLEIDTFLDQPPRKLSLGQRVRADFAASLLHNPSVLYLDEPTIGLDVAVKLNVYNLLERLSQRSETTVFLTSHDMKDLTTICDRSIIISEGRIIFDGKFEELYKSFENAKSLEEIIISIFQKRSSK